MVATQTAKMGILDLPDNVLNEILTHYLRSITYKDWAKREVVDSKPWEMFCRACELLLP